MGSLRVIAALTAVILTTGCAASSSQDLDAASPSETASPTATATEVRVVDWPEEVTGEPMERAFSSGDCQWSNKAMRTDAFRCFGDNDYIYDPCYFSGGLFVCPESAFSRNYNTVEVPQAPDELGEPSADGDPWGIELRDGNRCNLMGGATDSRDGMRLNYACDTGWLWGSPDTSDGVWQIRWTVDTDAEYEMVDIAVAVY